MRELASTALDGVSLCEASIKQRTNQAVSRLSPGARGTHARYMRCTSGPVLRACGAVYNVERKEGMQMNTAAAVAVRVGRRVNEPRPGEPACPGCNRTVGTEHCWIRLLRTVSARWGRVEK